MSWVPQPNAISCSLLAVLSDHHSMHISYTFSPKIQASKEELKKKVTDIENPTHFIGIGGGPTLSTQIQILVHI